ncbi:PAS domain S-box-containing protein [Halarchaeum rubridurum]|uniref:histidine kinase n=1 Tax=Halarchaeum rubridurum TaxID=489911 RepID=A0A830FZI9_9EURY|nr:ATP-binding protein [Halarchaeum rubridurum]MBP1953123.1 PAS domain S-box-containing protein [Halarchaeum rubridurum]GGM67719.1 hypothetical protein GCM10009017_17310 [Halarchaeum rubridurum]
MADEDRITVLYVNDDPQLLDLLDTQLRNEDPRLDVVTAETAARGRELLDDVAVDCVLSDYHLEASNGVAFLRDVRDTHPDLPFILFTETGNETVASESIEAGVTDYVIQKAVGNQAPLLARKITTSVEHRRAQREAERTDRRLREIVSVTEQVLWVFSADWSELQFINDRHEALFGQSTETLRDDPASFLERVHDDDAERVQVAMEHASGGEPQVVEYRVEKSDAVQLWVESRCRPIRDDDGDVVSIVGLSRDVTDRKVYQHELVEKVDQLEEFAGTVAHDLRNPLNVADGNVRLVADEHDHERLWTALDALGRMDALVEDLLERAREGERVGERQCAEFAELITGSYENVHAPGSSLDVTGSIALDCDVTRVMEAFENLIRNAVEHGSSDVTITAGVLADDRGVYVEDDGPGIPASERERVFEKGYTTAKTGSGFGLAIVERIVDGHGWSLDVREGTDGGARFEIVVGDA